MGLFIFTRGGGARCLLRLDVASTVLSSTPKFGKFYRGAGGLGLKGTISSKHVCRDNACHPSMT